MYESKQQTNKQEKTSVAMVKRKKVCEADNSLFR